MSIDLAKTDLAVLQERARSLRAELEDVEQRAQKITIYLEMAQAYGEVAANPSMTNRSAATTGRPKSGMVDAIVAAVRDHLRQVGEPVSTVQLLDVLAAQGIHVAGEKPRNNLSGMLSRSPDFTNDRSRGWGLVEWSTDNKSENDVSNPSFATVSPQRFQQSDGGVPQ